MGMAGLFFLALLCSCANFSQGAYNALNVSKTSYDATLTTAGELYQEGKIDADTKDQFIKYGDLYMVAHNEAVDALLDYRMANLEQKPVMKSTYMALADKMGDRLADLLAYLRKWKGGTQ
jgi:hypothetical protein